MNERFKTTLFNHNNGFYEEIKSHSEDEKEIRFNVYRNNVFVSLIDALADIFPVTQRLVGEDFFRAMAREYVQLNPPKTPIISDYGESFSDFARHFEAAKSLPFLGDLVALEYSLLALTNAPEYDTLEHEQISAAFNNTADPAFLHLLLPPTTQILVSPFAIGSIYLAHLGEGNASLADIIISKSEYLLLLKSHLYSELHIVSHSEAIFIKQLMQNKPLGEAVPDDESFDLGTTLAKLIKWKLITDVSEASA
ncbi:DUF2063 domain-containing protein [Marinomonas sp. CT5]|uniref:HvfC/BufC N-terminal domain-containing protein n=1 Tax=Marinomonas sp. CT5 TaxID=2066133 RepID=UPI001BB037F9|nr:DNA-binding domain-containing protein [Marinomonas sp. CT5]QUX94093.1 DUF2063 domain-containing protein [Marinomonas sp. CT5]